MFLTLERVSCIFPYLFYKNIPNKKSCPLCERRLKKIHVQFQDLSFFFKVVLVFRKMLFMLPNRVFNTRKFVSSAKEMDPPFGTIATFLIIKLGTVFFFFFFFFFKVVLVFRKMLIMLPNRVFNTRKFVSSAKEMDSPFGTIATFLIIKLGTVLNSVFS